jgi:hypothetical protein
MPFRKDNDMTKTPVKVVLVLPDTLAVNGVWEKE